MDRNANSITTSHHLTCVLQPFGIVTRSLKKTVVTKKLSYTRVTKITINLFRLSNPNIFSRKHVRGRDKEVGRES